MPLPSAQLSVPYIAWEIQAACNMGCPFCYSSSYNRLLRREADDRVTLRQVQAGLQTLDKANLGIELINWSGGEPLLRHKELPALLKSSRAHGFRNVVSTNAMFSVIPEIGDRNDRIRSNERFHAFLKELEPYLDCLAVSLDSADKEINNNVMRLRPNGAQGSDEHFDDVRSLIGLFRANKYGIRLKINTIVTRKNIDQGVEDIGELLVDLPCVWKLVQFNPRECPPENRRQFELSTDEFLRGYNSCVSRYQNRSGFSKLTIARRVYDGSGEPYCFLVINTSGQILLPRGESHVPLARLSFVSTNDAGAVQLHHELAIAIDREIRHTDTYSKFSRHGQLGSTDVFSLRNRDIFKGSYPFLVDEPDS